MTYRNWDKAKSRVSYNYKRLYEASQQALAQALRENRIHAECLTLAIEALGWYTEGSTDGIPAQGMLVEIKARLAELEMEIDNDG